MNRVKSKIFLAILLAGLAGRLSAAPDWQLLPVAAVDGSGIFLGQLLNNSTNAIPQILLAPAPAWDDTNLYTRQQIVELARRQFPVIDTTNWSGPAQIQVIRRSRQMLEFQVLELLSSALQREYTKQRGDLDVRLASPWTPTDVPDEELELKLTELPSEGLLPNSMIGFDLWCGKERIGSYRVNVLAKMWRDVPVARSPLVRGQLLRDADIAMERRDVLTHHDAYVNLSAADPSEELCENVSVGQAVLQHCVRLRPIIRRGQIVDAVYQDGPLRIALKVESLEEGAAGQIVRVRNPSTHRDLYGRIENEETILITL